MHDNTVPFGWRMAQMKEQPDAPGAAADVQEAN